MKRYLGFGLVIIMVLSMVLMSGCGGGGKTTTTTSTADVTNPGFTAGAVGKGEPFKLVFLTQPGAARAFEPFGVQPVVGILDTDGNIVASASLPISIGMAPETAGSSPLSGVLQVTAVNGQAVFSNVTIQGDGKGFILVARSSGLQNAVSQPFNVDP